MNKILTPTPPIPLNLLFAEPEKDEGRHVLTDDVAEVETRFSPGIGKPY
jgi:hypothetical protein